MDARGLMDIRQGLQDLTNAARNNWAISVPLGAAVIGGTGLAVMNAMGGNDQPSANDIAAMQREQTQGISVAPPPSYGTPLSDIERLQHRVKIAQELQDYPADLQKAVRDVEVQAQLQALTAQALGSQYWM